MENETGKHTEMLQHASPIPLYMQLKEIITGQIDCGILRPGSKIPSEKEFSERFDISRITVRRAISDLVDEGYLSRQQGKGTFVCQPKIVDNILENRSFSSLVLSSGMQPGTKILSISVQYPSETDMRLLDITSEDKILYIQRIRYANDRPVMLENNYFAPQYTSLIQEDLEHASIYDLLASKFGLTTLIPAKSIEIAYATEFEANCLQCKKNDPVILVRERIRDQNNHPVHHTKQVVTGSHFCYEII